MAPVTSSTTSDKPCRTDERSNTLSKDRSLPEPRPPKEFHYFPKLPPELRTIIWEMALRPCGIRGIHYFSLFNRNGESPVRNLAVIGRWFNKYGSAYGEFPANAEHQVAAPRVTDGYPPQPQPQYSWFKGNPSLYAWDAGLFNACRESMRIIVNRSIKPYRAVPDEWVVEGRHDEDGKTVHLRGHYSQDLYCFQFDQELVEASMSLRWDVLLSQLPFSRFTLCPSDIAFEFHPSWLVSLPKAGDLVDYLRREHSPRGLVARLIDAWHRRKVPNEISIWLIDRNIRMSKEVEGRLRCHPRAAFSDLQGTYVHIERWDIFSDIGTKRDIDSVFYLCRRLNSRERGLQRLVGVLACLPLPTNKHIDD